MSRQIPWPRILAEGIAIVVSILLAFGIQAWWEKHQERGDEQAALVRIQGELVAERERLILFESLHDRTAEVSLKLVGLIDELGSPRGSIDVPDPEAASLLHGPSYETETPTLDGLLRSDGINVISDAEVRTTLARWMSRVQDTRTNEAAAGLFIQAHLLPALISRGDIGHVVLNAIGRVRVAPPDADRVTTIQVDPELKAIIARRYSQSALVRDGLEQSRAALDEAVAAIGTALER